MKLKDFLTLKVGSGVLVSSTRYNPYINYSWSQTLTVGGNQNIKDTGTSGLNLQQFFGQGVWFNGIDQNITIETVGSAGPSPIWTICFNVNTASTSKYIIRTIGGALKVLWFNGGLTYYNGSANIKLDTTNSNRSGSYVVKSDGSNIYTYLNNVLISTISQAVEQLSFGLIKDLAGYNGSNAYLGILKDVYLFKKALSQIEIEKYTNQPNQFFMDSLEDSSCVLAMPMCEKDGFVRNYKSYSEGSNFDGVTLASQTVGTGNSITQNNNVFNITNVISTGFTYYPLVKFNPTVFDSTLYYMEIEVKCITGTLKVNSLESTQRTTANEVLTAGKSKVYTNISMFANIGGQKGVITLDGLNYPTFTAEVTLKNIRQLTSIYPITNYLATCRTNAQRLPYGLQTSGFKRDSNGLILGKSNFLECDGVGYCNTGWIPNANEDWSIEFIGKFVNNGLEQAHGTLYASATSRVSISVNSSGVLFTRCGQVYTIAGSNGFVENNVVMTYDSTLKIMKQFLNGVFIAKYNVSTFTGGVNPLTLSSQGGVYYHVIGDTRLFKVHTKALTQEEVTKNFNKYQSQGLLNE